MTRPLTIALIATAAFALLPSSWLARCGDVAVIANFPLTPIRDGAGMIAHWLQPRRDEPVAPADASTDDLYRQNEDWRRRYQAAELRIRELERQLEQLQLVPVAPFDLSATTVLARVTSNAINTPGRAIELNRGERHGVRPGAIAVVDGVYLVGRVQETFGVRSTLLPLASMSIGPILGRVLPAAGDTLPITDAPLIQLMPTPDGTFVSDPAREVPVAVGDTVTLDDPSWPPTAQMMIIGRVHAVETPDDQPLRHRVVVRPVHRLHRLPSVTLVMSDAEADAPADDPEDAR